MTPREEGFLLLTGQLGNPERRPLSVAQLRDLTARVRADQLSNGDKIMDAADLMALGYSAEMAGRILMLMSEEALLKHYLQKGMQADCLAITRVSAGYPAQVRQRLGVDSPGCLWAKGDVSLLTTPMVALVGSRELRQENRGFAEQVGYQAARQGYTLVSGNARGADKTAQEACLSSGGKVIVVVADALESHKLRRNVLYLSEEGFDIGFSSQRALSRNRVIHSMGKFTFVAQSGLQRGGTWDGTTRNLHCGWSPVLCFDDGSWAVKQLVQRGAVPVDVRHLEDLGALARVSTNLFDR